MELLTCQFSFFRLEPGWLSSARNSFVNFDQRKGPKFVHSWFVGLLFSDSQGRLHKYASRAHFSGFSYKLQCWPQFTRNRFAGLFISQSFLTAKKATEVCFACSLSGFSHKLLRWPHFAHGWFAGLYLSFSNSQEIHKSAFSVSILFSLTSCRVGQSSLAIDLPVCASS